MRSIHRLALIGLLSAAVVGPLAAKVAPTLAAALASSERPAEDVTRDADRKPAEILAFAGIKRGLKVVELAPGGGYYTRLLSLAVGPGGRVYPRGNRISPAIEAWAQGHPNVRAAVTTPEVTALAPEPVDVVWTTLNYHDFKNAKIGESDAAVLFNRLAFAALKPGGSYLVNDHDAAPGAGTTATATLHRIEMAAVIREVEAAGFKLAAQSPALRHPADDHTLKVVETGIRGKTDQFVLRFTKPKRR